MLKQHNYSDRQDNADNAGPLQTCLNYAGKCFKTKMHADVFGECFLQMYS